MRVGVRKDIYGNIGYDRNNFHLKYSISVKDCSMPQEIALLHRILCTCRSKPAYASFNFDDKYKIGSLGCEQQCE